MLKIEQILSTNLKRCYVSCAPKLQCIISKDVQQPQNRNTVLPSRTKSNFLITFNTWSTFCVSVAEKCQMSINRTGADANIAEMFIRNIE